MALVTFANVLSANSLIGSAMVPGIKTSPQLPQICAGTPFILVSKPPLLRSKSVLVILIFLLLQFGQLVFVILPPDFTTLPLGYIWFVNGNDPKPSSA